MCVCVRRVRFEDMSEFNDTSILCAPIPIHSLLCSIPPPLSYPRRPLFTAFAYCQTTELKLKPGESVCLQQSWTVALVFGHFCLGFSPSLPISSSQSQVKSANS